jgi:uncharacterized membrane protein YbhN (UPF0104 family)
MENTTIVSGKTLKRNSHNRFIKFGKWLIVILAYSFLVYKLLTFKNYDDFFREIRIASGSRFQWLIIVFLLLPFNWLSESIKWKLLVAKIEKISVKHAFKSFLAGISTGFFTPNRVGELVGRILFLKSENRKAGVTLSIVNSLTQNLMMIFCGIPSALFFFLNRNQRVNDSIATYFSSLLIFLILIGTFYFLLPLISRKFNHIFRKLRIDKFTDVLAEYQVIELLRILGITFLRYGVFCIQFYAMLRFFGVELTAFQSLIAIPTTYLFVSFTPSVAFSEAAVRSSYAVLFIGTYFHNELAIILAGMSIWVVNFVIPMLIGSVIVIQKK